ncbi:MAG: NnrS family protein [Chloroflexi bacterium]|nr:NnrS family protein [Chloroflexota bacterium]
MSDSPGATAPVAKRRATTPPGRALRDRIPSLPFIWWAIGLALTAGFGLGMALFFVLASGQQAAIWWLAAVQAHGHIQLFGWGAMFALGVGLYFLPRLRGCPSPDPGSVRAAAWLLGGGLTLRAISQPTFAALAPSGMRTVVGGALGISGLLELAGAALAVGALLAASRKGPPLASRAGLVAVLPFALAFFVCLLLALAIDAASLLTEAQATGLVPGPTDWTVVHLGLTGMLVSIAVAISARTFPLYLRLRVPPQRELFSVFAIYVVGFLLHATYALALPAALQLLPALGSVLEGLALLGLVATLDVPLRQSRRTPAGQEGPPLGEYRAAEWLIVPGYAWLGIAGLLLVLEGLSWWGIVPSPPLDASRHALGVGLVTLLILGMAARLLPGFSGRKLYSVKLVWATVWLGNAAAILRVAPLFLPSSRLSMTLLGISGLLGLAAVACLGWNLRQTLAERPVTPITAPRCRAAARRSSNPQRSQDITI